MKTSSVCKPGVKPLKIHKSCDPTWVRWSVSVPGVADTQWFKTPQAAAKFAAERGYVAIEEQASSLITINKAEHAALVAVAEAAHALMMTPGVEKFDVAHYKLAVAIRDLTNARNQQQSPTAS